MHRMSFRERREARRRIRAARGPRHRGPHDTRIVVLLVIAVTAFTFAVSDDSADITVQDLQEAR